MDITFSSKKLAKQLNDGKTMVQVFGPKRSKHLQIVLASLRAAANLETFAPPYSPPRRCHELVGDLKGYISIDLDHPYRLLFKPMNNPIQIKTDGGLDWSKVTAIEIQGVEDTHG